MIRLGFIWEEALDPDAEGLTCMDCGHPIEYGEEYAERLSGMAQIPEDFPIDNAGEYVPLVELICGVCGKEQSEQEF